MNRPYQQKALDGLVAKWKAGVYRQLHVMATGTGKTHCFAQLPKIFQPYLPGKMLVLAHREELIDQAIAKIQAENPGKRIDKEKAEHNADPDNADIVVASVASMKNRLLKYNWELFDKFVIDEAHHSTASTYLDILKDAGLINPIDVTNDWKPTRPYLLTGWTATPQRGDGEALAKVYTEITTVYTIREAIEDGWLVDVKGYRVRTDTSLDDVKTTAGDFNQRQLADTVDTPERNLQAYKAWMKLAQDRQTIGFCVSIEHAQHLAELFRKHDVLAEAIWGDDPQRSEKLAKFHKGEIEVLLNCDILTEGFDMWQVECIMNLAPTKSPVKYVQRVGRGTRLQPDIPGGPNLNSAKKLRGHSQAPFPWKQDCIVIDLVDNCTRNSLITLPTLMGLPNTTDLQGKSMVWAVKQLEDAQKEFPHVDFSKLPDVSKLNQFIQEVNLFDVVFSDEVKSDSTLSWHAAATGGYVLLLPSKNEIIDGEKIITRESVTIRQNLLDKWEMFTRLDGKNYKAERDTLAEVFKVADNLILTQRKDAFRLVKQEQSWHNEPATDAQKKTLKRFMKGKQIPVDLNKGKASRLISAYLAGRS